MLKRITAVLTVLFVLFCAAHTFADDLDDDSWTDDEFEDEGFEEAEEDDFRSIGGYDIPTFTIGDFRFTMNDEGDAAVLVGYIGNEADVVIPETADQYPVTAIGTGTCLGNPLLETIQIPGSIRSIGNNAFAQCPRLRSVVIREGLVRIDKCCFGKCVSLHEIWLPDSLEIVDDFAFAACTNLQEVTFGTGLKSIGRQAFLMCSALSRAIIPGGESVFIGEDAFGQCAEDFCILY